jgi:hypothetical protein
MAGLIQIEEKQWSVAGWVFDHVLRLARQQLPSERSSGILELIDESATGSNHLCLDNLSGDELSIFYRALEQAYLQVEREGHSSFSTPGFYSGFMDRFRELLEMIRSSGKT